MTKSPPAKKPLPVVDTPLAAGEFGAWLAQTHAARTGGEGVDVPCGSCIACCSSSYFVHVEPSDVAALAVIPAALLFDAPGLAPGHKLLGYDENGCCPMLVAGQCSIYAHRPLTCRQFDCRVLAAANVHEDDDKPKIRRQASRWRFEMESPEAKAAAAAVEHAATFFRVNADAFPPGALPRNAPQRAMLAIRFYALFLGAESTPVDVTVAEVMRQLQAPRP